MTARLQQIINQKYVWLVIVLFVAAGIVVASSLWLSAHPKETGGLPLPPQGFNPYFVGVCENNPDISCSILNPGPECGPGIRCMLGTCTDNSSLCNPYVCGGSGLCASLNVCSNLPTETCNPADQDSWPDGCGSCRQASCTPGGTSPSGCGFCLQLYCGGVRDATSCIFNTGPCVANTVLPAGCGTCQNIFSDFDNCPAGPFSNPCFDPKNPGVTKTCANPNQNDADYDLFGDVCDRCGDGICNNNESACSCPSDCSLGEGETCPVGIGAGSPLGALVCGDNNCDPGENCAPDCGFPCTDDNQCPIDWFCYDARSTCSHCFDNDGDSYSGYEGDPQGCPAPLDCADSDPAVNPGASESAAVGNSCADGIDNNCNALIDCAESSCSTHPSCGGGGSA